MQTPGLITRAPEIDEYSNTLAADCGTLSGLRLTVPNLIPWLIENTSNNRHRRFEFAGSWLAADRAPH